MKKTITLLLLMALLLASCGGTTAETETTAPAETVAQETEIAETEPRDSLPADLDFAGETVTLYVDKLCSLPEFHSELTGDVVEDAVYYRNLTVEERLNVALSFVDAESSWSDNLKSFCNPVSNSILAGDAAYDIVAGYGVSVGNLASDMLFQDLSSTKYIDFDQPWWPDSLQTDLAVDGKLFFASGDISSNMVGTMFCVMFNKDLLDNYQIEYPYALVDEGKWTLDALFTLGQGVYQDLNANEKKDDQDLYGIIAQVTSIDNLYYSCGMNIVEQDPEAGMVVSPDFGSEKMADLVTKLCALFHDGEPVCLGEEGVVFSVFQENRSLWALAGISDAVAELRDVDFGYGIIPTPKWDEAQEDYHTTIAYTGALYAIPLDVKNPDLSSAVMEALAVEGYYTLSPAFFETALKVKYASDPDASRMYDIMKASLSFDFGRVYSTGKFDSVPGKLRVMVVNNQTNWASTYQGFIAKFEKQLADFVTEIRGK